jgi:glutamate racemase
MIGVFDSGIGGLTLLHELMQALPHESFIYYADTKNVPYSYKTPEQISQFVEDAVIYLRSRGCKSIVLACNTATNVAVEYLRSKYDFPIIAIQPAVKVAADNNTENKRILACATPITLKSERFNQLIHKLQLTDLVDKLPLPRLVEFAEREEFDSQDVLNYLKDEFSKFDLSDYQYIVLGCTHFTYFEELIEANFSNLKAVDGNKGTAKQLKNVLYQLGLMNFNGSQQIDFVESGEQIQNPERFWRYLNRI